jgi:hypothetical protein
LKWQHHRHKRSPVHLLANTTGHPTLRQLSCTACRLMPTRSGKIVFAQACITRSCDPQAPPE